MKRTSLLLFPFFIAISPVAAVAQTQNQPLHAPDGGTLQIIRSISIPAIANAPFSATVLAEWTRTLEDGTTITIHNRRMVMRDSAGRIFQERSTLVPNGTQSKVWRLEISDPARHIKYFCFPDSHSCLSHAYFSPVLSAPQAQGPSRDNSRFLTRVDLGTDTLSGIDVVGTRETTTITAGVMGNDRAISITKDFWYAPSLGINLSVKRVDPRSGTEAFTVTDISRADPDPQFFSIPAGYVLRDPIRPRATVVAPNTTTQ